jgi:YVTN family beta-propeller protein
MFDDIVHVLPLLRMVPSSQRRKTLASYALSCGLAVFFAAPALFPIKDVLAADATGRLITSVAIAVNPITHQVYAVDEGADSVIVTDESTGSAHRVEVGKAPIAIAVLPGINKVYVVNANSDSISVIDGTHDRVITTIKGGSHPYTIAADRTRNKVYVTYTYDHILTVIDGARNTVSSLETGSADAIEIDERTNTLFLSTYEDPFIRIVDAASGAMRKVEVGGHIWGLAFDAASSKLYLAHTMTADVMSLDEKTQETTAIPVGQIPCALAFNPSTHMLYAVNYGDHTMSVIDTVRAKVVGVIAVGDHPQALAVDTERNRVYVANVHGNSVMVIDGVKNAILHTFQADGYPYALAVDQNTGQVYAAVYGSKASVRVDRPGLRK